MTVENHEHANMSLNYWNIKIHVVTVSRNNILSFMGSGGKKNPNLNEWE